MDEWLNTSVEVFVIGLVLMAGAFLFSKKRGSWGMLAFIIGGICFFGSLLSASVILFFSAI